MRLGLVELRRKPPGSPSPARGARSSVLLLFLGGLLDGLFIGSTGLSAPSRATARLLVRRQGSLLRCRIDPDVRAQSSRPRRESPPAAWVSCCSGEVPGEAG